MTTSAERALRADRLRLGVCYYPEQWPESMWEDDYRRMRELGFSVVRVAEFAWSVFEPEEGRFEFGLFDRALDAAHRHGLQVILGTPTATPPAWLTHKYPETLNARADGVLYRHGQRRHYNYNAPIYRELSARIVRKMAEHYKDHPAVVGWQIDNELNCEINVFYAEADHAAFRVWLREKYGSLDRLNAAWGAVFWNQTYTDWEQVRLTGPTPSDSPNPHQALDEKRFFSDSAISFAKLQADILRDVAPGHWVTTNGLFGHLDSHKLTEQCLDFMSYDSYPNFSTIYPDKGPDPLLDRRWGWNLSAARDMSPNFCVMEQQSGPGGWVNRMEMPAPKPGQMRLWTYQSIAHGADMVLYFRWRTAVFGTEIYWHGLNDYHNEPNRRIAEARRIGEELRSVETALAGTRYRAEAAIVRSYANEWDGELDRWHGPLTDRSSLAWFKAFQRSHIPVDTLFLDESTPLEKLSRYKLLVYPHAAVISDAVASLLEAYVREGGTIVFGCRSGYKDERGHCYMRPLPGPLAELCGVRVEDFTLIGPHEEAPGWRWAEAGASGAAAAGTAASAGAPPSGSGSTASGSSGADGGAGDGGRTVGFLDVLQPTGDRAETLAVFDGGYMAGKPALVRNGFGEGAAYYYGSAFDEATARALLGRLGVVASPIADAIAASPDIEVAVRAHPETGEAYLLLLNYAHEAREIELRKPLAELLTGETMSGRRAMAPFEVYIFRW